MNNRIKKTLLTITLLGLAALGARAQGTTAFTYQGRLNDGGSPAQGTYDLRFALFDSLAGSGQQGNTLTNSATVVSNGLFTVPLDFGNQFPGAARWLEIGVRTNGGGGFGTLTPRQPLTPTPYAIFSGNASTAGAVSGSVPASQLTGLLALAQLPAGVVTNGASSLNLTGTFSGAFTGNAAGVTNLNSTNLTGTIADARLSANVPLLNGTNVFTGTNRFAGVAIVSNVNNQINGTFAGNGAGLTNLNSTNLTATIADSRLSTNVALLNTVNRFIAGSNTFGSSLRVVGNGQTAALDLMPFDPSTNAPQARIQGTDDGGFGGHLDFMTKPSGAGTNSLVSRMRMTSAGNLGIGTNNPQAALHMFTSGFNPALLESSSSIGAWLGLQSDYTNGRRWNLISTCSGNGEGPGKLLIHDGSAGGGVRMSFDTAGNVGIGTPTPGAALHVYGNGPAEAGNVVIQNAAAGEAYAMLRLRIDNGSGDGIIYKNSSTRGSDGGPGTLTVRNDGGDLRLQAAGGVNQGILVKTSGNIGIGAPTPTSALEIIGGGSGGGAAAPARALKVRGTASFGSVISCDATTLPGGKDWDFFSTGGAAGEGQGKLIFRNDTDGNSVMTCQANGNVGIGTTIPSYPLEVVGAGPMRLSLGVNSGYGGIQLGQSPDGANNYFINSEGNGLFVIWNGNYGGGVSAKLVVHNNGNVDIANEITCVAINITSDRNAKEDLKPVSPRDVLAKVASLPITEWQYKTEKQADANAARHIGPMAQDFSAAFALGHDEKHISLVDESGVALAAIQGLNEELKEARKDNDALRSSIEALQAQVQQLARKLSSNESR